MTIDKKEAKNIMTTVELLYLGDVKMLRKLMRLSRFKAHESCGTGGTEAQIVSTRLNTLLEQYDENTLADVCKEHKILIGEDTTPSEALTAHLERQRDQHYKLNPLLS